MALKYQKLDYINDDIKDVFHFMQLKGHHNFLIGSKNIRNMLFSNDYDLNSNIKIVDGIHGKQKTLITLTRVYDEFKSMFEKAHQDPQYYILDFKCGYFDNKEGEEPIRWSYDDMMKGYIKHHKKTISFEEALMMEHNTIKLDMCFVNDGLFTDINCLYNFYIVHSKEEYEKEKNEDERDIVEELEDEIEELESEGQYYKALKRYFSLGMVQRKMNKDILEILNSDLGMYYKFISSLKFCVEMLEQTFKKVDLSLIKSNLNHIKEFGSHITKIDTIDKHLDRLNEVIKINTGKKLKYELEELIEECSEDINERVKELLEDEGDLV